MAAPIVYSESGLFLFMQAEMQHVGKALNWNNQVDYQPAIDEVMLDFGVSNMTAITDIRLLRARARVHMWRLASQATAGDYNFSADGGSYSRAQVHEHAMKMLAKAEEEVARLDGGVYAVIVEERALPLSVSSIDESWEWH